MADTKLRSPDGTRERWFNEKEVAHLTTKSEPGERWTIVPTSEKPPRDPHDVIEETPTEDIHGEPVEDPVEAIEPEEAPIPRPKPKPLPKPANKGKGR